MVFLQNIIFRGVFYRHSQKRKFLLLWVDAIDCEGNGSESRQSAADRDSINNIVRVCCMCFDANTHKLFTALVFIDLSP